MLDVHELFFSLTEDLKIAKSIAKSIAKEYKEKLENCQEVIVALVGLTNGKREELFGRILYRKGDDGIVETKSYLWSLFHLRIKTPLK